MKPRLRGVTLTQQLRVSPAQSLRRQQGRVTLPAAAALVLALALLLRAGLPLWNLLVPEPAAGPDASPAQAAAGVYQADLAALQALGLFAAAAGSATASAPLAVPTVSTALDLRLEGVLLAADARQSRAIIVVAARPGTYRTGESLPVGAGVVLDSIARDHVIIDNRGQREALWLFAERNPAPAGTPAAGNQLSPAPAGLSLPALAADQRVLKTAATLAEIITVSPAQQNGFLIGYRLSPGARLKEFVQLGFRTNDIVTAVNGIALNDAANVPQLYSLMNGATEVSFSLLREGAPMTLHVVLTPELSAAVRQ